MLYPSQPMMQGRQPWSAPSCRRFRVLPAARTLYWHRSDNHCVASIGAEHAFIQFLVATLPGGATSLPSISKIDASFGSIRIAAMNSGFFVPTSPAANTRDAWCGCCRGGDASASLIWLCRINSAASVCGVESGFMYIFPLCICDDVSFRLGTKGWLLSILSNKFRATANMASSLASTCRDLVPFCLASTSCRAQHCF